VLNGTILMILATCIVSTFATQRGAHNIAMNHAQDDAEKAPRREDHILIPVANERSVDELVGLSAMLKRPKEPNGLYALHAIDNKAEDPNIEKQARKVLDIAATTAAAGDLYLQQLLRYDVNISNAIVSVVRERNITDIVLGMHQRTPGMPAIPAIPGIPGGFGSGHRPHGDRRTDAEQRHHLHIQPRAAAGHRQAPPDRRARKRPKKEAGFQAWVHRIRQLAENSGAKIVFFASEGTLEHLRPRRGRKLPANIGFVAFDRWDDLPSLEHDLRNDDCLWFVMSRRERVSYHPAMNRIPGYLEQYFAGYSYVLLYPRAGGRHGEPLSVRKHRTLPPGPRSGDGRGRRLS